MIRDLLLNCWKEKLVVSELKIIYCFDESQQSAMIWAYFEEE